jgi:Ni/Fe-hydrogenase subunit HybB-like protein
MNWLRARIARSPRHALILGKIVFLAGAIAIVGAVFARAALLNVNAARSEAKLAPLQSLAQAYPHYPTWIVPEGPVGYAISALLVLVGMVLTALASEAQKQEEARRRGW